MRVISGIRKGHKLKAPKGLDVRPTEDRIKESLFNMLKGINSESIVLDLFAGTGSIGIEFLSRGALKCYFVDLSPASLAVVKENLQHTKLEDLSVIVRKDAVLAIKDFNKSNTCFDFIYIDPPFRHEELMSNVLETIDEYSILADEGTIIIEHEKELELKDNLYGFIKINHRNYGSKTLTFYKRHII